MKLKDTHFDVILGGDDMTSVYFTSALSNFPEIEKQVKAEGRTDVTQCEISVDWESLSDGSTSDLTVQVSPSSPTDGDYDWRDYELPVEELVELFKVAVMEGIAA